MSKSVKGLEYLGSITVDSGQAIIGDPCYLDEWQFWDDKEPFDNYPQHKGEYGYLGSCNATLTDGFGNLGLANAVAFTTGYGDGMYHVYGELDDPVRALHQNGHVQQISRYLKIQRAYHRAIQRKHRLLGNLPPKKRHARHLLLAGELDS